MKTVRKRALRREHQPRQNASQKAFTESKKRYIYNTQLCNNAQ